MKNLKIALYFPPESTEKPVTYHLIKDYNLIVSILHANITAGKGGKTILHLSGSENDMERALVYIKDNGITYKIFAKTVIWNEDECINCGLCTGICPSGALKIDNDKRELEFEAEKCLVCETCLGVCPMRAIDIDFFD